MKAILIDPENHTVTEVEYNGNYKHIYELIGCETFTVVDIGRDNNGLTHSIFVDDEGLLNNPRYFFIWNGYQQPLAGKGLILGCDEEGETVAATLDLEAVRLNVSFTELSVRGFKEIPAHKEMRHGQEFTVIGHQPVFAPPDDDAA